MSKVLLFTSSAALALALIVAGCAKEQSGQQPATSPAAPQAQTAGAEDQSHEGHEHGEAGATEHAMDSEHKDALAELSPEDRALAEKQKVCPVSGEPLGSMGKPFKVTVNDREVFLCCEACEAEIKGNPEKYLAKLPK